MLKNILIKVSVPISITLSANIMLFPVLIIYFNSFSFCFLLSNIIASFLDSIIVVLGVIGIIVPEIPIVFVGLFKIEQIMLDILMKMADMLSKLKLDVLFRTPNVVFVILWYVLIYLIYISFDRNKKKIILKYKLQRIRRIVIALIILTICSSKIYYTYFDDYVYFFNVGQGDMALVKENNNTILIDSGSITNNANSILENYLKHENISSISYVVLSHFHEDHINYFYDIAEKYKVKGVIYSTIQNYEEEECIKFKNYLKNKEISQICVEETDKIDIGKKLSIKVIAPLKNKKYNIKDLNEISLVVKVCINNKNILFMGDATKKSEINILESSSMYLDKVSILKVGHHGSKTSTSEEFLKTLNTKFAVISSKKSEYGHPDKEVVDLLERYSIKTFITEKVGGIKIKL